MHRGGLDWLSTRRGLIETGFEDGADGGIAERIDRQCPIARRFQTLGAVPARERYGAHRFKFWEETQMTETHDAVINEALNVIDKALSQMMRRELVSSGEITDVLLDVRALLTMPVATPVTADAR